MKKIERFNRLKNRTAILFESFERTQVIREIEALEIDSKKQLALIQFLTLLKEDEK